MEVKRNYEAFKESISSIVYNNDLSDDETDRLYMYLKADLYNIDVKGFENNLLGLEREIDYIESTEKRIVDSRRESYKGF